MESLNVRVHSLPPNVDQVSTLFQDFYARASLRINLLLSASTARQPGRATSKASSRSSSISKGSFRARAATTPSEHESIDSEQQMLSAAELHEQRDAKRKFIRQQAALEEAVERRACEKTYAKLWRHRSTQDEEQDDKLRSRTAALSMVGIGLKDLGLLGMPAAEAPDNPKAYEAVDNDIYLKLSEARENLQKLDHAKYPFQKLQCLRLVMKTIVEALSTIPSASVSADDILPMMIYTLITGLSEDMHVMSNLYFIQRFRDHRKLDGEAAYSLTTLEAAIGFLETVDLKSLRADEAPPVRRTHSSTSSKSPLNPETPATSPPPQEPSSSVPSDPNPARSTPPSAPNPNHNRRPSRLLQNASDAVRGSTDQGLRTFSNALDHSFKFFSGKLQERQTAIQASPDPLSSSFVPKTLAEARLMVSAPSDNEAATAADDDSSASYAETGLHSLADPLATNSKPPDRFLPFFSGRRPARDLSTDSTASTTSVRKPKPRSALGDELSHARGAGLSRESSSGSSSVLPRGGVGGGGDSAPSSAASTEKPSPAPAPGFAFESVRNFGSALNPLARFSGMGMGFGRPAGKPGPAPEVVSKKSAAGGSDGASGAALGPAAELTETFPDLADKLSPRQERGRAVSSMLVDGEGEEKKIEKIRPPNARFLEVENPGELRINEVLDLLRDYRRLAAALSERKAFQ